MSEPSYEEQNQENNDDDSDDAHSQSHHIATKTKGKAMTAESAR